MKYFFVILILFLCGSSGSGCENRSFAYEPEEEFVFIETHFMIPNVVVASIAVKSINEKIEELDQKIGSIQTELTSIQDKFTQYKSYKKRN